MASSTVRPGAERDVQAAEVAGRLLDSAQQLSYDPLS
ncbi:MAG: diiron oxygenase, partial [Streptomyces sp.]|nr:diiron oxygenase [Streptomyces sp.]